MKIKVKEVCGYRGKECCSFILVGFKCFFKKFVSFEID